MSFCVRMRLYSIVLPPSVRRAEGSIPEALVNGKYGPRCQHYSTRHSAPFFPNGASSWREIRPSLVSRTIGRKIEVWGGLSLRKDELDFNFSVIQLRRTKSRRGHVIVGRTIP